MLSSRTSIASLQGLMGQLRHAGPAESHEISLGPDLQWKAEYEGTNVVKAKKSCDSSYATGWAAFPHGDYAKCHDVKDVPEVLCENPSENS